MPPFIEKAWQLSRQEWKPVCWIFKSSCISTQLLHPLRSLLKNKHSNYFSLDFSSWVELDWRNEENKERIFFPFLFKYFASKLLMCASLRVEKYKCQTYSEEKNLIPHASKYDRYFVSCWLIYLGYMNGTEIFHHQEWQESASFWQRVGGRVLPREPIIEFELIAWMKCDLQHYL